MSVSMKFYRVLAITLLALFIAPQLHANWWDDAKFYIKNRAEIKEHSKNVTVAVRELYRDRKSVSQFAHSATVLMQAYKGINQAKPNIPQLLEIASAIDTLVKEYNYLSPKCEKLYNQVKPDLEYFSAFQDDINAPDNTKPGILKKTITDSRISKLAGGAGWSRVWDSIKENPLNAFRWGKLQDEYKYGKSEAMYVLKTAQTAYEAAAYYQAAQKSMSELLDIRTQINKLLSGDINAILNMNQTINKVTNGVNAVNDLGVVMNEGIAHLSKRFDEVNKYQNEYLEAHKAYQQKYNVSPSANTARSTSQIPSSTVRPVAQTSASAGNVRVQSPYNPAPTSNTQGSYQISLAKAQENYQKVYREYTRIISDPSASAADRDKAVESLRQARQLLDLARNGSR